MYVIYIIFLYRFGSHIIENIYLFSLNKKKTYLYIIQTVVKLYFINKKKSFLIIKFLIEYLGIIDSLFKVVRQVLFHVHML